MKGRIYKISCKTDPNLVYVGSTTKPLRERLLEHKCVCKKMSRNAKLYNAIYDNDWSNWEMELIEEVEFEDKKELRKREGEYIKSIGTLNHYIAGRDMKEWCENNKNKIKEIEKQYRENNIEKIKEYQEEYYQKNKEKKKEYEKQYYEDNKDKVLERQKEYRQKNKEVLNKYQRDARKADNHYSNTLLKKCFNAFKNHRDDLVLDCNIKK